MSGAMIIGTLLSADTDVLALVTVDRIEASMLPDNTPLPALLVRLVSSVDRQTLKREAVVHVTERVAVTVRASSYQEQGAVIRAVRRCCAGKIGNIGGGVNVSILTAGTGPDLLGPAGSFEQTQDFRISFNDPA